MLALPTELSRYASLISPSGKYLTEFDLAFVPSPELTDTQLVLLAAAAWRPEGAIELACDLKGGLQEGRRQYWCQRRFDRA